MKQANPLSTLGFALFLSIAWLPSGYAENTNQLSASAKPQSLLATYHQALNNEPALKSALSANKAAQELIAQGKALYRPQVSFAAGARATQVNINYIGNTFFQNEGFNRFQGYQYGISAQQPIYRKQNLISIAQSKTQVHMADKKYLLAQQQLILKVTQAYFNVLITQDHIDVLVSQKAAIQNQLDQAQANFKVGNATITDVNEAKARYDMIVAQELSMRNTHQVAQFALEALTKQKTAQLATIKENAETKVLAQDMQAWVDIGLKNNLAIQIQQDALSLAKKDVEKARAGHFPTLDAFASYTKSRENGGNFGFGIDLDEAVIGLQLSLPIYQGGATSALVRQAAFNQERAQHDIEVAKQNTVLATQQAYLNLSSNIAEISALTQALKSSESQLASTQLGYDVGIRTSVDLLDAQQLMFGAKRKLLQARYEYLMNIIRLKTTTGQVAEVDLIDINQQLNTH